MALCHDAPSVNAGSRTDINQVIAFEHHVAVVFYHDDAITAIAQGLKRGNQLVIVALMQSDAGFIQDIQYAHEL